MLDRPAETPSDDVATLPLAPAPETEPALRRETIPVDDNPDQLLGQSNAEVYALLGEPGLIRRDGPAEIWQYRASDCILDVFLYQGGNQSTVRHVELRGPGTAMPERRACFARMLTDQRAAAG